MLSTHSRPACLYIALINPLIYIKAYKIEAANTIDRGNNSLNRRYLQLYVTVTISIVLCEISGTLNLSFVCHSHLHGLFCFHLQAVPSRGGSTCSSELLLMLLEHILLIYWHIYFIVFSFNIPQSWTYRCTSLFDISTEYLLQVSVSFTASRTNSSKPPMVKL